jgi:hypothetical protein
MSKSEFTANARWIWHPDGEGINQYVDFVRDFKLGKVPKAASLRIAADSDYRLWINGVEMPGRQFPCYPHDRVFDRYDVGSLLRRGDNRIAVLAYFRGVDGFEYRLGRAGLLVELSGADCQLASDAGWLCRIDPVHRSGDMPRTTFQLGFTVEADARREDGWWRPGQKSTKSKDWRAAAELAPPSGDYWKTLRPRPLPMDARMEPEAAVLVARGEVLRPATGDVLEAGGASRFSLPEQIAGAAQLTIAQQMMQDFRRGGRVMQPSTGPWTFEVSGREGRGPFGLFDLGVERFGELRLVVEATPGTVLDIAHGEHLDDLGVRAHVGGRHFADRYICGKGRQEWTMPFRRIGARYLQLHISHVDGKAAGVTIHRIGVLPRDYPGPVKAVYESADRLMDAVREVSIRTLRLGMTEHFCDCPWREQGLYGYDGRNSALFNYLTFGDYDFAAESIRLLGSGQREDGLLELCAPARVPITIPSFSLAWIMAVRDHFLFSGKAGVFREFEPVIRKMLAAFISREDERSGLFGLFIGEPFWTFYEWAPGLDFKDGHSFGDDGKFRLDAPHNLYLIEAFDAFADLLDFDGRPTEAATWRKRAKTLRRTVAEFFWDERRGLFASFGDRRRRWHYSAATQAVAIVTGVANARQRRLLQPRLFATAESGAGESLIPMTISTQVYGLRALRGAPEPVQRQAHDELMRIYGGMLLQGATSLWETERGADEFDLAGSLCHAWAAVSLWFSQAYVLGVEPLEPGFRRFRVNPHPAGLPGASGVVPTPRGALRVAWDRQGNQLDVRVNPPKGLEQVR